MLIKDIKNPTIRRWAEENRNTREGRYEYSEDLFEAFDWDNTEQRYKFWHLVNYDLLDLLTHPIYLKKTNH